MTPHNSANPGDFAKTVIMPGDPKRAEFIASEFLSGAKLVNDVRGVKGYTGCYGGKRVSVMASGMGMPSIGIYSFELFTHYDVEAIIRAGSAGAISDSLSLRDIVIAQGACTDSAFANQYSLPGTFAPIADYDLLVRAVENTKARGLTAHTGNIVSSDVFYNDLENTAKWQKMGVLAVEMEAAALYMTAAYCGKKALTICTISDTPLREGPESTSEEREKSFTDMIEIALETAYD